MLLDSGTERTLARATPTLRTTADHSVKTAPRASLTLGKSTWEICGVKRPNLTAAIVGWLAAVLASACSNSTGATDASATDGQDADATIEQSPECDAYLRCVAELTPEGFGPLLEAYGPSGTCWEESDVAQLCSETCESALESLETAFGDGACENPSGTDSTGSSDSTEAGDPVDIDLGEVSCVEFGTHQLRDFVVSGDPDSLACTLESGPGAGRFPAGLSVSSDCGFEGSLPDDRVGGWAVVVRVEQSAGPDAYVPFCARTPGSADSNVEITPTPVMRSEFSPNAPVSFGGDGTPRFEIRAPPDQCEPGTCLYTYEWDLSTAGFDLSTVGFEDELLVDGGDAVGMSHGLSLTGPAVPAELNARPWVQSLDVDYCFGTRPLAGCSRPSVRSAFAVVMHPG